MQVAAKNEDILEKLVIVDMGIKSYPMHHDHILKGIHAVKLDNVSARREADAQMDAHIDSYGIKQFLLKNLYWKEKGQLAWRMNVAVLEREMPEILKSFEADEIFTPTLFLRGEISNYVLDEDLESIEHQFADMELETIANAGHWVHAEAPNEFLDTLLGFCLR